MNEGLNRKRRFTGIILFCIGIIGVVTGFIPFVTNGMRILMGDAGDQALENALARGRTIPLIGEPLFRGDLAAHGVEAMGLSVEWGMLSSAMGTYLGFLLLVSGRGWMKGRGWAPTVTWLYVVCGLCVNLTDMIVFVFRSAPGRMRSHMLVADGIALLIPIVLMVWLICRKYGWRAAFGVWPQATDAN
ncbi:MAG: hypothetical protein JXR37_21330 [Kiritimatiellae bacterium]|nr:hypothetical protein [Kiritimatiellia bacterium]